MEQLRRAIRILADQTITGYYFDELSSKPLQISFQAMMHPDDIIAKMNTYFGDQGNQEEHHLKQTHKIDGIDVYEFTNKTNVRGAIAITNDRNKAEKAFGQLNLMEKGVESETKQPKDKDKTKSTPTTLQLVVTDTEKGQATKIKDNLTLITQQAGMPLKVEMKETGEGWEYSFKGTVDKNKLDRLKEKVNDYLYNRDFEWLEKAKAANTGDYSYEPTYL